MHILILCHPSQIAQSNAREQFSPELCSCFVLAGDIAIVRPSRILGTTFLSGRLDRK